MELTPLVPAPLPCLLFGLGSVLAAATTLALATPNPRPARCTMARPAAVQVFRAAPRPGPNFVCTGQRSPAWLSCQNNACNIDKASVQRERANLSTLLTTNARVIPIARNGQPVGLKVYAIPPCSRAFALGLRNGDLLTHVNGLEVSTPSRAMQAYAQLRTASHFKVDLERGGHNVTYEYTLR